MKNLWTDEEIKALEDCYKKRMSMAEMAKLFPDRTRGSISSKAGKMGFSSMYIKKMMRDIKLFIKIRIG